MSCNICTKPYSLLRREKGCPGCGFSYCSKCLNNKVFVPKLNAEAKVCSKCKLSAASSNDVKNFEAPDAYYKRIGSTTDQPSINVKPPNTTVLSHDPADQQIMERLQKLREDRVSPPPSTEEEIASKLKNLKGDVPTTSDAELHERLAKLRGVPIATVQSKPTLPAPDLRTEQEQADDIMKQYLDQANIDNKYQDEFDEAVNSMQARLQKLKGAEPGPTAGGANTEYHSESENEEEAVKKIIDKMKAESVMEEEDIATPKNDELPFCEICNEDARMRCLGCKYLFCKRCFMEHKDDDDGCNRYEPYTPPKGAVF